MNDIRPYILPMIQDAFKDRSSDELEVVQNLFCEYLLIRLLESAQSADIESYQNKDSMFRQELIKLLSKLSTLTGITPAQYLEEFLKEYERDLN